MGGTQKNMFMLALTTMMMVGTTAMHQNGGFMPNSMHRMPVGEWGINNMAAGLSIPQRQAGTGTPQGLAMPMSCQWGGNQCPNTFYRNCPSCGRHLCTSHASNNLCGICAQPLNRNLGPAPAGVPNLGMPSMHRW